MVHHLNYLSCNTVGDVANSTRAEQILLGSFLLFEAYFSRHFITIMAKPFFPRHRLILNEWLSPTRVDKLYAKTYKSGQLVGWLDFILAHAGTLNEDELQFETRQRRPYCYKKKFTDANISYRVAFYVSASALACNEHRAWDLMKLCTSHLRKK